MGRGGRGGILSEKRESVKANAYVYLKRNIHIITAKGGKYFLFSCIWNNLKESTADSDLYSVLNQNHDKRYFPFQYGVFSL